VPNSQPKSTLTQQLKIQAMESSDNYLSVEKVEPVDPYDRIRLKKHRTNKKPIIESNFVKSEVFSNLRNLFRLKITVRNCL
jgi:hypothetical protein